MRKGAKSALGIAVLGLGIVMAVSLMGTNAAYRQHYGFVGADHPDGMWDDGPDRWASYSAHKGDMASLAATARAELIPLGFKEDNSKKPWFHFVNAKREVIIAMAEDEVLLGSGKFEKAPRTPGVPVPKEDWPIVYVKNAPGTEGSLTSYLVLKMIHRW